MRKLIWSVTDNGARDSAKLLINLYLQGEGFGLTPDEARKIGKLLIAVADGAYLCQLCGARIVPSGVPRYGWKATSGSAVFCKFNRNGDGYHEA